MNETPGDDELTWDLHDQDEIEKAKSKLIMDFGLEQSKPERVTLEVLKQLIREKPERMSQVVRKWLRSRD